MPTPNVDTPISGLPAGGTVTGAELLPAVQGGNNVSFTASTLKAFASPSTAALPTTAKQYAYFSDTTGDITGSSYLTLNGSNHPFVSGKLAVNSDALGGTALDVYASSGIAFVVQSNAPGNGGSIFQIFQGGSAVSTNGPRAA